MGANNNYHNYEQKQPQQNAGKTSFKIFQSVLQEMTNEILFFFLLKVETILITKFIVNIANSLMGPFSL